MLYQLYIPSDAFYIEQLIKKADKLDIDWDNFKGQIEMTDNLHSFLNNPNMVIRFIMNEMQNMLIEELKEELNISQELEEEIQEELDRNTYADSYTSSMNTTEAFEALEGKLCTQAEAEDRSKIKQLFDKYYIKPNLSAKDVE